MHDRLTYGAESLVSFENRKAPNDPQTELGVIREHFTVTNTLYTLNTYPWGPSFGSIRPTTSGFQDKRRK